MFAEETNYLSLVLILQHVFLFSPHHWAPYQSLEDRPAPARTRWAAVMLETALVASRRLVGTTQCYSLMQQLLYFPGYMLTQPTHTQLGCPHKNLSYANFLVNTLKSGWILSLNTIHYLKMQGNFAEILKSMDLLGNFKFRIRKKLISPETLRQTSMELCSVPFGDSETRLRALLQSMIYSPYKWNFAIQQNFVMRMHCHAIVCFTNVAQQIPEPLKINICKRFMKFNFFIIYTMLLCFH